MFMSWQVHTNVWFARSWLFAGLCLVDVWFPCSFSCAGVFTWHLPEPEKLHGTPIFSVYCSCLYDAKALTWHMHPPGWFHWSTMDFVQCHEQTIKKNGLLMRGDLKIGLAQIEERVYSFADEDCMGKVAVRVGDDLSVYTCPSWLFAICPEPW